MPDQLKLPVFCKNIDFMCCEKDKSSHSFNTKNADEKITSVTPTDGENDSIRMENKNKNKNTVRDKKRRHQKIFDDVETAQTTTAVENKNCKKYKRTINMAPTFDIHSDFTQPEFKIPEEIEQWVEIEPILPTKVYEDIMTELYYIAENK